MSEEDPPPYSAVVGTPLVEPLVSESFGTALPFSYSNSLATRILKLVSEGQTLDSHFKNVRDVTSAGANFEYQELVVILCQRFEMLVWESRNIAGVALVAIKDFNEVILDFLSEPDVVVQDRLKELANASKLLQRERNSATNQKSSLDALIKDLEDFHQILQSEPGALVPKRRRRRRSYSKGRETKSARKPKSPFVPRSEPLCGLSMITASFGAISKTFLDYSLQFERVLEEAVLPSRMTSSTPEAPAQGSDPIAAPLNLPERKRLCPPIQEALPMGLTGLVNALVRNVRAFASQLDVFDTVFTELARAQDIFVVYLKDGQSIANQGYRFEISRLRRCLPRVCNALDAYSKARVS